MFDEFREVCRQYDQFMAGRSESYITNVFTKDESELSRISNNARAVGLMKYALDKYLGWNHIVYREFMSQDLLDLLHLTPVLSYLDIPAHVNIQKDLSYLVYILYPSTTVYDERSTVIRCYEDVLAGGNYPRRFFSQERGLYISCLCFYHAVTKEISFEDTEAYYRFFSSQDGMEFICRMKLNNPLHMFFSTPVEFAHEALPPAVKDQHLFQYYTFLFLCRKKRIRLTGSTKTGGKL